MLRRSPNFRAIAFALIISAVVMLTSTYGLRIGSNGMQALAFLGLYLLSIRLDRTLALLSVLTFIILGIFTREAIQSTESIRGVLFALVLILFSNENRKIAPALGLYSCWFIYFCLQLLPVNIFDELIVGIFPVATSKTVELMLYELIGISFFELVFTKQKNANSKADNLFGYQTNFLILSISTMCFVFFAFSKSSLITGTNLELRNLPNPSSVLLLMLLSGLLLVLFLSAIFSKAIENIFAHLELCATPDASFLTLTRNPALPLVEFQNYSKSIRKKSEALTASRKKATELKVELSATRRQVHDLNEKLKDLAIMADSINIGLLALTTDGTITYVNRQFYEMLNLEMSHAEMLHYDSLITLDSVQCNTLLTTLDEAIKYKRPKKILSEDLLIDVQPWSHLESASRKSQNTLGSERIMVFLKRVSAANTSEDLDLSV